MRDIKSIVKDLNSVKKFLDELPENARKGVDYIQERMGLLQIEKVDFPEHNVTLSNKAILNAWSRVRFNAIKRKNNLNEELCNTVLHNLRSTPPSASSSFFGTMFNSISSLGDNSKEIIASIETKISRKDKMYEEDYQASILETVTTAIDAKPRQNLLKKLVEVETVLMQDTLEKVKTLKKGS